MSRSVLALLAIVAAVTAGPVRANAQTPAPANPAASSAKNDYSNGQTWLCRPGRSDACAVDLSTTIVKPNGELAREGWTANAKAPIDCFYVYPTVSTDPTDHSDMQADPAELNVVRTQFARFASQCRPFAPLYRQITLAGLRKSMAAPGPTGSSLTFGLGYDDVVDAWNYYLEHDNQGRGVVLIGHSQGSFVLAELMKNEIDGKPIQARLISALLLGAVISVPKGQDVGGSFKQIPLCRAANQIGCVITYASYRSTIPPPANTLFGRVPEAGMAAACTNPAGLGGGSGELHTYLSSTGDTIVGHQTAKPWTTPAKSMETPWVSLPGLLTARCTSNEHASGYLEVTVHGDPADARVDDIFGDIGAGNQIQANWGLHLIDVDLAIGNLVDIVGQQGRAFAAKKKR
jgi:hypothetical protein